MTVFMGACSVTSCPFNLGDGRVTCDWLHNGRGRCHHPQFREAWQAAYELEQAQAGEQRHKNISTARSASQSEMSQIFEPSQADRTSEVVAEKMQDAPARPSSLAARVAAAQRPMDAARARQILDLGEV